MPKLSDVYPGDVFHTIIKGENGTGKSIAAVSYAVLGPTFVFDFEDRMRSVANYYRSINRPEILTNVEYDTYYSFSKLRKKLQAIEQSPKGLKNVVWDSLTSFTNRALSNTKEFKATGQAGDATGRMVGEFRVNTLDDFSAESAAINEFVIEHALILKSMKINFILTAHVIKVTEKDDERGTHIARYLMTGGRKAGQIVPGYYDEMYHTNIKPGMSTSDAPKYTVRTRHSATDTAKSSMNLPVEIDFTGKVFYEQLAKFVPIRPPIDLAKGELVPGNKILTPEILKGEVE